ncbi:MULTISPECIES: hypothetical protein [Clostridia]|uniref:hypothetical protein n=1 Tax=Clostridia TaxID=186801 RepID=UPI000EAC61C2|nr:MULTISPECIES: hypothetical protein [Clostridia]RKQ26877.1 hypothetical protein D8Q48_12545 [Ruminococcus sp. B05]TAP32088.1 hypothetical protein EYA86_11115 [Mediterraneibacter sp. gm002]
MKRYVYTLAFFCMLCFGWMLNPLTVHAEIASDRAFDGAVWEKIIEDDIEAAEGVVQSMCVTDYYIIMMENVAEDGTTPDIIKAYYRYDHDENGQPVERYSLAKRVQDMCYEHCNGMAFNPNTREIVVALYTSYNAENRGCVFLLDADTLEFKGRLKITDDYNILGIGYDQAEDCYYIQTNADGGYTFKKLDSQFQIIDDYGTMEGYSKGTNFQDLCVSGDYIINLPLTLHMGIGDYINMYSISRRVMVSDTQMNFNFEGVSGDEPESICELEPGLFAVTVTQSYADGRRTVAVYKTMVPYNFPAADIQKSTEPISEGVSTPEIVASEKQEEQHVISTPVKQKMSSLAKLKSKIKLPSVKQVLKVMLLLVVAIVIFLAFYMRLIAIRRERQRKLEKARRERKVIRERYED